MGIGIARDVAGAIIGGVLLSSSTPPPNPIAKTRMVARPSSAIALTSDFIELSILNYSKYLYGVMA